MPEPLEYANRSAEHEPDSPNATAALIMCGLVLAAVTLLNLPLLWTGNVSMCSGLLAGPLGLPLLAPLYLVPSAHIRREPLRWWATGGFVVTTAIWCTPIVLLRVGRVGW